MALSSFIEHLPVEVLDNVFDILSSPLHCREYNDPFHKLTRDTLSSCHAACRLFRALARPRLFRQVWIMIGPYPFPFKQVERLLELGEQEYEGGVLQDVQEFIVSQEVSSFFYEDPVKQTEQDRIGDVIHQLLDLATAHRGRLQAVRLQFNGASSTATTWDHLGGRFQSALIRICSPGNPITVLELRGFRALPLQLLSSAPLTTLVLEYSTTQPQTDDQPLQQLEHSETGCSPDTSASARHVQHLGVKDIGDRLLRLPLDLGLINNFGAHLKVLELQFVGGGYFIDSPLYTVGSLAPSSSLVPSFPRLKEVQIQVPMLVHELPFVDLPTARDLALQDYFVVQDKRKWTSVARDFLLTLPIHHAPNLDTLQLMFQPTIGCHHRRIGDGPQSVKGWALEEWLEIDAYLFDVLQARRRRQGALLLHLRVVFAYRYQVLSYASCGFEFPLCTSTEEDLWDHHGLPRASLNELLPRTLEAFSDSVSFRESFRLSHASCRTLFD